jgi:hypothetical protein
MKKKRSKSMRPVKARRGRGHSAGRSVQASDLPDDLAERPPEGEPHVAPQGLPVSAERYRAMKKRARTGSAPPAGAQEDPSEDDRGS